MSNQPFQVLYAKYNSTRRPEFRITTEVCEDANGRFVLKRANGKAAEAHLEQIRQNGLSLQGYYRDIKVIDSEPGAGGLRFPYVKGRTLADQIDARHFDKETFVARVNEKLATVLAVQEQYIQPFESTADFEAAFGKVDIGNVPAANPANIDSLLTNFIENEDGITCIDCEWVFHFPVPLSFIKYRILLYLYVTQVHAQLQDVFLEEMLNWFGFTGDELEIYWQMEERFQQYAHGEDRKYIYTERYRKEELTLQHLHQVIDAKEALIQHKEAQIQQLHISFDTISNSFFWRITQPARTTLDRLKQFARKNEFVYLTLRTLKDTLSHGFRYAYQRRRSFIAGKRWLKEACSWPSEGECARQRRERFPKEITFSILVPLYNTPEPFLREMIASVQNQTYEKWELCMADGSDDAHAYVGELCEKYAQADSRVRYRRLEKNLGISGNTNACIEMATGDFIALFDHDDLLHPSALFEVMKAICEKNADFIYTDENTFHNTPKDAFRPNFKPDYAPDTLRSYNYICHLSVFSKELLIRAGGGFKSEYDGSQDYDLILRLTEQAGSIVHIPKILYFWRSHPTSTASDVSAKPYTIEAAKRALTEHLKRIGLRGDVMDSSIPSTYRIQYAIPENELISIIIPNKDHIEDLDKCIASIRDKSTYDNWEIIVIENNSTEKETFAYYEQLITDKRIKVVYFKGGFNYSAINNFGAKYASGQYLLLLNNDIEIITPDWLEQMLMFAQRNDVGAVGAMLYYPDETVQHAGVILGIGGVAGHAHKYFDRGSYGYMSRMTIAQDMSAVTAACMLLSRRIWDEVGGLDEGFSVAFNDIDLCMRIRKAGYLIVWTPYAELYHYESKSRGLEDNPEKIARFSKEIMRFKEKWIAELEAGDPYYNPNLTLEREDFSIRSHP